MKALVLTVLLSGCAGFGAGLADVRDGVLDYNAGLAKVCPQQVTSTACEVARDGSVTVGGLYADTALAYKTGEDISSSLVTITAAIEDAWAALKAAVGKQKYPASASGVVRGDLLY